MIISCRDHGDFQVRASNHLLGVGCKSCGIKKCSTAKLSNIFRFTDKANKVHNSFYQYKRSIYINSQTKLIVTCPFHGDFLIAPCNHLFGKGCSSCATENSRKTLSEFIQTANLVHDSRYSYVNSTYTTSRIKMEIICPLHGVFYQSPASHCQGYGCPSCGVTGFKSNLPGILYILLDNNITKIGISNCFPRRLQQLNSKSRSFNTYYLFSVENGSLAQTIETQMLKLLRNKYKSPLEVFDGYTECFYDVDNLSLVKTIRREIWSKLPCL